MPRPALRRLIQAGLVLGAFSLRFGVVAGARAQTESLNVSRDPTQELNVSKIDLVTIFGGWAKARPIHFGDGSTFDQFYRPAL
ncbi:hypothetical protein [Bosea sp. PAMC 26642]|uniref:hypothetical protein n=1 Tax=Bosea sp. (strain PAMC 26642) TaxID=1792307 RepID=UPI0007706A6D|nr:hypothetical protein [Bosea sp. PAMC 26642]AMJ59769.1 hypothetical protein AXW83_05150 [Bosea sp. PAMC 26642]